MSFFRKTAKFLMRYKILIFAAALLLCFGGELVTLGNEVGMRVLVTSIGIDKEGSDYKVSAQIFTPQLNETKSQSKNVVSVTAPTIADGLSRLSLRAGRIATSAHCRLVVLGDSLLDANVMQPLNYFKTDYEVGWGAIVVATSGKAEETLNGLNDLEKSASFSWQKFLNANRDYDTVTVMSLREAFLRHDEPGSAFLLNVIDVEKPKKEGESGGGSSGGETGGSAAKYSAARAAESGGDSGSGGSATGQLKMGEKTYVMKDGRRVGEVGDDEIRGYSWLDEKVDKATFPIEKVEGGSYNGATVSVRMKKRSVHVDCKENSGKPVLAVTVDATFEQLEVLADDRGQTQSNEDVKKDDEALSGAIEKEIKKQIEAARKKSVETSADFLSVGSRFFRARTALYDRLGDTLFKEAEFIYEIGVHLSR